jgi:hypothetical protein
MSVDQLLARLLSRGKTARMEDKLEADVALSEICPYSLRELHHANDTQAIRSNSRTGSLGYCWTGRIRSTPTAFVS